MTRINLPNQGRQARCYQIHSQVAEIQVEFTSAQLSLYSTVFMTCVGITTPLQNLSYKQLFRRELQTCAHSANEAFGGILQNYLIHGEHYG